MDRIVTPSSISPTKTVPPSTPLIPTPSSTPFLPPSSTPPSEVKISVHVFLDPSSSLSSSSLSSQLSQPPPPPLHSLFASPSAQSIPYRQQQLASRYPPLTLQNPAIQDPAQHHHQNSAFLLSPNSPLLQQQASWQPSPTRELSIFGGGGGGGGGGPRPFSFSHASLLTPILSSRPDLEPTHSSRETSG